jgi:hypothetical protein
MPRMTAPALTKLLCAVLTFSEAFSAFSTDVPWLIATSFFLARGFIATGLGNRVAYMIVSLCGHSSLTLTYDWPVRTVRPVCCNLFLLLTARVCQTLFYRQNAIPTMHWL